MDEVVKEVEEVKEDVEPEQELKLVTLVSQERQAQGMLHQGLLLLFAHQQQGVVGKACTPISPGTSDSRVQHI